MCSRTAKEGAQAGIVAERRSRVALGLTTAAQDEEGDEAENLYQVSGSPGTARQTHQ